MTRSRLTLGQLMAVVVFVAFGFGALRNANEIWASGTFTLAFLMISVAPLGALARKGRARMAWAGVAVFGWSRLLVGTHRLSDNSIFGPIPSPGLLSERGFALLLPYLLTPGDGGFLQSQIVTSMDIILWGFLGRLIAGRLISCDA
jgi:hypothetical protein